MGSCGCAEEQPDWWMPGPDGSVYTIRLYRSCHYCLTPAGVVVGHVTDEADADAIREAVPRIEVTAYGQLFPVLDPDALRAFVTDGVCGLRVTMEDEPAEVLTDDEASDYIVDDLGRRVEDMVAGTFLKVRADLRTEAPVRAS